MKLMSEHLLRAVARRLNFRQGVLVPEAVVTYADGGGSALGGYVTHSDYLADLMWITSSSYATEFEIKVSLADWRADLKKGKWGYFPPWISRFIYVVPIELGIPDFVPAQAGVWHYTHKTEWYHRELELVRAPKRIGHQKVPDNVRERWLLHLHCRFWHQRVYGEQRLPQADKPAIAPLVERAAERMSGEVSDAN